MGISTTWLISPGIVGAAVTPLLAEKQQSRKEDSSHKFGELSDGELVQERFDGNQLELIALGVKNLILRVVGGGMGVGQGEEAEVGGPRRPPEDETNAGWLTRRRFRAEPHVAPSIHRHGGKGGLCATLPGQSIHDAQRFNRSLNAQKGRFFDQAWAGWLSLLTWTDKSAR